MLTKIEALKKLKYFEGKAKKQEDYKLEWNLNSSITSYS